MRYTAAFQLSKKRGFCVSETPKCQYCGNLNCAPCVAREYLTKLSAVLVQVPRLTAEQRQHERERAPTTMLNLALSEALIEIAMRALKRMSSGRWDLCAEHTTHTEPLAAAKALDAATAALGGEPTNVTSTLLREDPAVMRHTMQRFGRLWLELREGKPDVDTYASLTHELDELAHGVLS